MALAHGGDIFSQACANGWDWHDVLDFSASINPLGPSPHVRKAIIASLDKIVHYPDRYSSDLVLRLAEEWSVDPDSILVGNGATELIHFLSRVWVHQNTTLIVPTFSEFHRAYPGAAWAAGANIRTMAF
ncbi:MAG: aminotransferase class I/II-fold pyridoxal phosphate-dependent enzyme [Bryobacteraceae bacterium]